MSNYYKRTLFILGYLFTLYSSYGQVINASICNKTNRFPVTPYAVLLKTTKPLSLYSVLSSRYQNQFEKTQNKAVIFDGYDPYYYWFRFVIKNDELEAKALELIMAPIGLRKGQLYQKDGEVYKLIAQNGLNFSFKQRPYQYSYFVFPFTLPPATTDTLYFSMDAMHAFKSYGFALMQPQALRIFQNRVYFSFGFIAGLLLLFSLFNFYLYFTLKDKVHLWYAIYITLLIWIVLKNDQLDQEFFSSSPAFIFRMAPLLGLACFALAILMHVILLILTNLKSNKLLFRFSQFAEVNLLLSGIGHFIVFYIQPESATVEQLICQWADKSCLLAIVIIIIDCVYSIIKGSKNAIFLLAGILVFLIGAISRLLLVTNSSYLFPPSLFHLGMMLETLIISFGLIYRYRLDRKEKLQYLREKEELRNSFDKLILQSKFEIQEQTLKNISLEIHDNIGQILSLVKLNIANLIGSDSTHENTKLNDSSSLLTKAINDLRDLSKSLNTEYIMEMGLPKSIEYTLDQIKRIGNYKTEINIVGKPYHVEPQKELILFRMYQEILNNIIKHAAATCIKVELSYRPSTLNLLVQDDGKGFNMQSVINNTKPGLGLKNIRNRAALINATCDIESNDLGTKISIAVSVNES